MYTHVYIYNIAGFSRDMVELFETYSIFFDDHDCWSVSSSVNRNSKTHQQKTVVIVTSL